MSDDPCGTYAGHQRHRKRGEKDCDACLTAAREYVRAWRATPAGKRSTLVQGRAQSRALTELAQLYPEDYHRIYRRCYATVSREMADA